MSYTQDEPAKTPPDLSGCTVTYPDGRPVIECPDPVLTTVLVPMDQPVPVSEVTAEVAAPPAPPPVSHLARTGSIESILTVVAVCLIGAGYTLRRFARRLTTPTG